MSKRPIEGVAAGKDDMQKYPKLVPEGEFTREIWKPSTNGNIQTDESITWEMTTGPTEMLRYVQCVCVVLQSVNVCLLFVADFPRIVFT